MMAVYTLLQVGSDIAQLQPESIKPQTAPLIEVVSVFFLFNYAVLL